MKHYPEYEKLDLPELAEAVRQQWEANDTFNQSISHREGAPPFVFYEGPPSANGLPGIHHVMSRTIKDLFCRYKTQKGFQVQRKAGWDTHGLPVELAVEKALGITKEDIGTKISIAEYNQECRKAVMRFTEEWNAVTRKMGYWVNMDAPYVTYHNQYIETVWWLLQQLHNKDLLYKGYSIQPYSPKAGTGLSSHELNLPGCYRDVKDQSAVAQFSVIANERSSELFGDVPVHLIAWTTTPWTLPSNTALAVGPKITYVLVRTFNQYSHQPINVILAKDLMAKHFKPELADLPLDSYEAGSKKIPYEVVREFTGTELVGLRYEQLLPYVQPMDSPEEAFRVIPGDFVTTEDGTGIVHIAPTFGADDMQVAKAAGVPPMLVPDKDGNAVPLVDLQGRFVDQAGELAGKYVKNEYYNAGDAPGKSVDVEIVIRLKQENKCFHAEKYVHSYPHCWRTDKPVLYYPLDSWFIRSTAVKERMIELNKTINWKPASTGTGRFGEWLNNLHDWNLSRSRYWGIPLPIWRTEDGKESVCIGSAKELKEACEAAVEAGLMEANPLADFQPEDYSKENYDRIDLHRPYADEIVLASPSGQPMHREADLIDVWFDSGAMPYAQLHYPFENKDLVDSGKAFPADYIAEGVDQTRGWFFTLHAIATMCFDSVAYRNVVSNGLVLDKNGLKMSKRLGNAVDPFKTLDAHGADATRWYMIANASPWDNLKFDEEGITEAKNRFFRAVYNSYAFFALYANIDGFSGNEASVPVADRPEIDRWILSKLNTMVRDVDAFYADYDPTRAARAIQEFAVNQLSNWYVRQNRKRFWKGALTEDKVAAYQTLHQCLQTIAQLAAPVAPFFSDQLFKDLSGAGHTSVHLTDFPVVEEALIDPDLEERMDIAQKVSSMVLSLRKKERIKVRQPLQKIMLPVLNDHFREQVEAIKDLVLAEINVKELEYLPEDSDLLVKRIKPDFKRLGPRFGKQMKAVAAAIGQFSQPDIQQLERQGTKVLEVDGTEIVLERADVDITSEDIPGWLVSSEGAYTVALDITLTDHLREEGMARELVNRIQNLRKDKGFEVTDTIQIRLQAGPVVQAAIQNNLNYICAETLTHSLEVADTIDPQQSQVIEVDTDLNVTVAIEKSV